MNTTRMLDEAERPRMRARSQTVLGSLVVALAALLAVDGAAGADADTHKLFPLGVYWPQTYAGTFAANEKVEIDAYADRILGELKKNHCNFIWVSLIGDADAKRLCELASKHGIQVAVSPEVSQHPGRTRAAATPRAANLVASETFKTFGQVKGCWGYVLDDEPGIPAQPYLEAIERELLRLDPSRPVTTVFRRTEAAPAIQRHDMGIVTVDNYPFGAAGNPNLPNTPEASRSFHRGVIESLGRAADKRGIELWVMPGAFQQIWGRWYWSAQETIVAEPGAFLHWRMPTVGEMRWQVWESLACGAKGIVFYTLWPDRAFHRTGPDSPPDADQEALGARAVTTGQPRIEKAMETGQPGALLNIDSTPTRQLIAMGEAYREVAKLAPLLQRLSFASIPAVFAAAPLRCQTFEDGDGAIYAMVVNDDTDKAVSASLRFLPGIQGVRDLRQGQALPLVPGSRDGLHGTTVSLEGGGGTLLHLEAPVATRPLAKVVEDFSTPGMAVSFERAEVGLAPNRWGTEFQHAVVPVKGAGKLPASAPTAIDEFHIAQQPGPAPAKDAGELSATVNYGVSGLEPSGPLYVVYRGEGNVRLSFSSDGKEFTPVDSGAFDTPILVPKGTKQVRFSLDPAARLFGFCTIGTEAGDGQ